MTPDQTRAFAEAGFELFGGKDAVAERAYDCRAFVCRLPVEVPSEVSPTR
mgnify:CR=1 FL=1